MSVASRTVGYWKVSGTVSSSASHPQQQRNEDGATAAARLVAVSRAVRRVLLEQVAEFHFHLPQDQAAEQVAEK